jgi:hypothetical protein
MAESRRLGYDEVERQIAETFENWRQNKENEAREKHLKLSSRDADQTKNAGASQTGAENLTEEAD